MIALRPYQEKAIAAILAQAWAGQRRQCLVLACGLGKTVIFCDLVRQVEHQALILVHRDELVHQTVDKLIRAGTPREAIGIIKAEQNEVHKPCVIASVQTVYKAHRLQPILDGPAKHIVVADECHHLAGISKNHPIGNTWYQLTEALMAQWPHAVLLGCTATPFRPNNSPLIGARPLPFQVAPYTMGIAEGIAQGYLSGVEGRRVTLEKLDLDTVRRSGGDWNDEALEAAMIQANALPAVLDAWKQHARTRRTLAYFPTVRLAEDFAKLLEPLAPCSVVVGETDPDNRAQAYEQLRHHTGTTVANCMVLTEGFDEPSVDAILLARPTTSRVLYQQVVGRGLRPYPGKDACLVIDCVGATTRHNLMSLAHIAGLVEMPQETDEDEAQDGQKRRRTTATGAPTQNGARVRLGAQEIVQLHRKSPMRWVTTRHGRHLLQFFDGMLLLEPCEESRELWQCFWVPKKGTAQRLVSHVPLEFAQGVAEDTARDREKKLISPKAMWLQAPPTEKQMAFARKLGITGPLRTRGEASDAITAVTGDWERRR